jgi:signal transduction histidine kinase
MSPDPRRASGLLWQVGIALAILTAVFALFNALVVIGLYSHDRPQLARDVVSLEAGRILRDLDAARAPAAPDHVLAWHWEVRKPDGQLIASGGDPGLTGDRPFDPAAWTRWRPDPSGPWISGSTSLSRNGEPVWVTLWIRARSVAVFDRAIRMELLEHVAAPLAPLTLMLLLAALLQVRRLTAPLRTAAREADSLDPDQLGARLTVPATSLEVQRLVQAFNRTLDRVEASIRLVRDFNANAAHELRTPLAVMSLAIDGLPPSELRDTLLKEAAALSRTVSQMLDLAQVDAMPLQHTGEASLKAVTTEQVSQLVRLAWSMDRDLSLDAPQDIVVEGHTEAIGRALRNLIENGLRHTPPKTTIEISVGPGPQIRVRDHGPGVAIDQRTQIFDRFWRGDRSFSQGAGLGLSIVRAIMTAHGGLVRVDSAPGGGAVFILAFPELADISKPSG